MKRSTEAAAPDPLKLKFTKMHGAGNDFIVFDCRYRLPADIPPLVPDLTDRRFGIGADGVIMIEPSTVADFRMVHYNRDGSRAICGNAMRCAAQFIYELGVLPGDSRHLKLEIDTGIVPIEVIGRGATSKVDMGMATFEGIAIPTRDPGEHVSREFQVDGMDLHGTAVGMGNPHLVIFVEHLSTFPVKTIGPKLEHDPFFPQRTNVQFVELEDRTQGRMRSWERGVGETLACGSGICAAFAVGIKLGMLERQMQMVTRGGEFQVVMVDGRISLTGPAEKVFVGELNLAGLLRHPGE